MFPSWRPFGYYRGRIQESLWECRLQEHEAGFQVKEIIGRYGIAEQSFYRSKSQFGGMEVSDTKRLRELEAENAKLKKLLTKRHARHNRRVNQNGSERCPIYWGHLPH